MRSSKSSIGLRQSFILIQTLICSVAAVVWVFIGVWVMEDDVAAAVARVVPLAVLFELGVLSRYFPGVRQLARSLETWNRR